jgi:molybdopterin-synthase adenylyltransferase
MPNPDRYARQILLPQVGIDGQRRIRAGRVVVIGVGALGTIAAELLARAGVGHLTVIDRDVVELSNLQRQLLFTPADLGQAKAAVAAARLNLINPEVEIVPVVADVNTTNIEDLIAGADVILECSDNVSGRYLLNDACVKQGIRWVYGGAVGVEGRTMAVVPGASPCLRCLFQQPPEPGELPTCDVAGVLNTATALVGTLQANLALRLLLEPQFVPTELFRVDLWNNRLGTLSTLGSRDPDCKCCSHRNFEFLQAGTGDVVSLCGRGTVQVLAPRKVTLDLDQLAHRWQTLGTVQQNKYLVRVELADGVEASVFRDGRLLLTGVEPPAARGWYDRLVGS